MQTPVSVSTVPERCKPKQRERESARTNDVYASLKCNSVLPSNVKRFRDPQSTRAWVRKTWPDNARTQIPPWYYNSPIIFIGGAAAELYCRFGWFIRMSPSFLTFWCSDQLNGAFPSCHLENEGGEAGHRRRRQQPSDQKPSDDIYESPYTLERVAWL